MTVRKQKLDEGKLNFDQPETEAVAEKMLELAEFQKKGQLKPYREKDVLNTTIDSKDHGGRIRGVTSTFSIKDGFENDWARYRSHDRYKQEKREAAEKAIHKKCRDLFMATLVEQQ